MNQPALDIRPEIRRRAAAAQPLGEALILDPRDPLAVARTFVRDRFTTDAGAKIIYFWRGELRAWTGTHYARLEEAAIRSGLYEYLEDALRPGKEGSVEAFRPNTSTVNHVLDALRAARHLDAEVSPPAWIDGTPAPDPRELVACHNGLLHLPTRQVLPHSPGLLCTHALPFPYHDDVGEPEEFQAFVRSLWPDDPESIDTLQEVFGYFVSGETRLQKMFLLVGPRRGGKGTLARVLQKLLGEQNVAGPTLSSLASNFGLQSLIAKPAAIVSDARLSGRTDETIIVERLLSITGEDLLTVDRKHRDPWIGQLPTRFVVLTNELPRLSDTSGALAGRFVILTLARSWYGREDTGLFDRLVPELPAILRWSLDGLDRLRARGRFSIPQASLDAVQELEDLSSPVGAFIRDCCAVEPGAEVDTGRLYKKWRLWCEEKGRSHPTTEQVFGRDLRAAVPGLSTASRRGGSDRWRVYVGIRLEVS